MASRSRLVSPLLALLLLALPLLAAAMPTSASPSASASASAAAAPASFSPGLALHERCYTVPGSAPCAFPLQCAGQPGRKRCVAGQPAGSLCLPTSHVVCRPGFVCQAGRCALPAGAECASYPSLCGGGRVCSNAVPRVCAQAAKENAACSPHAPCDHGLRCVSGACARVDPLVFLGEDCGPGVGHCREGLCSGDKHGTWCVEALTGGAFCGGPYKVCGEGLACAQEQCRVAIPVGGQCGQGVNGVCVWGTVCAGQKGIAQRCVPGIPEDGVCGLEPEWKCGDGMSCVGEKCTKWV